MVKVILIFFQKMFLYIDKMLIFFYIFFSLPGDQILDINGIEIGGRSVSEISEIIKGSPELVVCTVKPSSDYRYCDTHTTQHTEYAEIDLDSLKIKDDEDNSVLSSDGSSENQGETKEQNASANDERKRHSLPTVLPQSARERNKEESVNFLELNFPGSERPRGRSDVSRSPRIPSRGNRERGTPGAYIELEFNNKEKKIQEGTGSSTGDGKSNSLPRR